MGKQATTELIHPADPNITKKEKEAIKQLIELSGLSPTYGASNLMRLMFRALYLAAGFEDQGLFNPAIRGRPSDKLRTALERRVKVVDIEKTMALLWKAARIPGQEVQKDERKRPRKKTRKDVD